jgi:hypothetical protein
MIAQVYPDVVNGGFFSCGMDFYRTVADPLNKSGIPGFWSNPPSALLDLDRQSSRFILQTTSKDGSLHKMQLVRDAMIQDGFHHVTYLEVPEDSGKGLPLAEWFDKGITALDAPLASAAQKKYRDAQTAESKHLLGDALSLYRLAAAHGDKQSFVADAQAKADQLNQQYDDNLKETQSLIANKQFPQAIDAVHKFQARWGALAAGKGRDLIQQIDKARSAEP